MVINTPSGKIPLQDEIIIRQTALHQNVPVITTLSGAQATIEALVVFKDKQFEVTALQDYHA